MKNEIKSCEICSTKFSFSQDEHILANDTDEGHYTALFPEVCQRCNTIITHLDAACSFSHPIAAKEIIEEFKKYSDSSDETVQFVDYCTRNFS